MNREDIERQVKAILSEQLDYAKNKMTSDSNLIEELGVDSFGVVEIIFALEENFNITIPENDLAGVRTIKHMVEYLMTRLKGEG